MDEKTGVQKAEEKALGRLDDILDHYSAPDFLGIVGRGRNILFIFINIFHDV